MKILVANLGSTSLKWRLFDFSNGQEQMLAQRRLRAGDRLSEGDRGLPGPAESKPAPLRRKRSGGRRFKTVMAKGVNGCVRLDESVVQAMEAFNGIAPAHNPPYISGVRLFAKRMPHAAGRAVRDGVLSVGAGGAVRYAVPEAWYEAGVRAGDFTARATSSLPNGRRNCWDAPMSRDGRRIFMWTAGKRTWNQPDLRVISCHLGGSSSITGILNGVAIGNSMG